MKNSRHPMPISKYFRPGEIVIQMANGTQHHFHERELLPLIAAAQLAMQGQAIWPIPPEIFVRFPRLRLLRDRAGIVRGESALLQVVDGFLHGPAGEAETEKHAD